MFLAKGHVLRKSHLTCFYDALCPPRSGVMAKFDTATLHRKSFTASADAKARGEFTALVAVFNNIDKGGDRIVPGAFTKTLAQWRASGDPVPVIWSHDWGQPDSHIGVAYAKDMVETDRGLLVKRGQLDIDDNPVAARVHKLMARRSVKEFSFGYSVAPGGERKASDGANELLELDLVEIGPTLKGLNPATELRSVKASTPPPVGDTQPTDDHAALKAKFRDEMYALLTHDSREAGTLEERLDKRVARAEMRQLGRQCDRMRLEESLGWDTDLINRFLGA
jgi:HK97 family phage prohead protease